MSQYTRKRRADSLSEEYQDEQNYMPAFGSIESEHVFREKLERMQVEMKSLEQARVQDKEERTKIEEELEWSHKLLDQLDATVACNHYRTVDLEEVQQLHSSMKALENQ
ncbi:hypothetical protein BDR04DRAFT_1123317, partial [Suillus decipiens]